MFSGGGSATYSRDPNNAPFLPAGHRINVGFSDPSMPGHRFQKLKPNYDPGDLGFDPFGLKPSSEEGFRRMQNKELQNGRVAMLAAAGFLAQEVVAGDTWGAWWNI